MHLGWWVLSERVMQVTHTWQGLDLPGVEVVIQWKLKCTMCTLWQQIGRAACRDREEGITVVLVEKTDFDIHRQKKEATKEKRCQGAKQKAATQLGPPAKCHTLVDRDLNIKQGNGDHEGSEDESEEEANGMDGQTDHARDTVPWPCIAEDVEVRWGRYTTMQTGIQLRTKGKWHSLERGSVIDDFVNAKSRGLPCRWEPTMVYFGNDKISSTTSMSVWLFC